MALKQMMAPAGGKTTVANGRSYTAAEGTPISVPDFDAGILEANGWVALGEGGTTAARPVNPKLNQKYVDTTVGATIHWDGKTWRHSATGAAV